MAAKYTDIEFAFDFVNSGQPYEHEAYLNIHTGETYWHSAFDDIEEALPDDIDDSDKYISLPHKNDLGLGKRLVLNFTYEFIPQKSNEVEYIFSKKGAYAKFKRILDKTGLVEKWYEYENMACEKALREWCKLNGIKIDD